MAVKVKTKITHTGSDAKKIAEAFHEVHAVTPKIVRHTAAKFGGKRAEKQRVAIALSKARSAGASIPDASGANYVSRNDLHVPDGATKDLRRGGERVKPSGQAEAGKNTSDLNNYPGNDAYRAHRFPALHEGDAQVRHEIDMCTVKPVDRKMNPIESVRQANNKARDTRTNLGRGKAGMPTVEEENAVTPTR